MSSITTNNPLSATELSEAWKQIQAEHPGIRTREAAALMQSSEAQLLASCPKEEVIRLTSDWKGLLKRLPELGEVMSLTRNDACILEHDGAFEDVRVFGKGDHHMGLVIGPIETRVFLHVWHVAFAVKQQKGERRLTSIQVFDKQGNAITKIYLRKHSNYEAYEQLVKDFTAEDQGREQAVLPEENPAYNTNIDSETLIKHWDELKDTHDFFPMLKKFNAHRYQALELAKGKYAFPVRVSALQEMLETASKTKLPIMVFAGNKGNLQIHQDKVRTIRMLERGNKGEQRWLNVLDPKFNMHLRLDLVKYAWQVIKPTRDGDVHSIECYDANKNLVVQFFGLRKPGEPELNEWKELVHSLNDN